MSKMHTLAFQIDDDMYVAIKGYDDYTSVAYWYQTLPSAPLMPLPTDADVLFQRIAEAGSVFYPSCRL